MEARTCAPETGILKLAGFIEGLGVGVGVGVAPPPASFLQLNSKSGIQIENSNRYMFINRKFKCCFEINPNESI